MLFSLNKKKSESMKIKKFYYYSPEKLKLVPIKNFISKAILLLILLVFLISFISVLTSYSIFSNSSTAILTKQNTIIEKEYEKEIELLKKKYVNLADKFKNIGNVGNDLRLAANLEPVNLDDRNFGIGGSEFSNLNQLSSLVEKDKLSTIYDSINEIEMNIKFETSNYEEIKNKIDENMDLFCKLPAIRPVKSAIGDRFGFRFHPILKRKRMHHGLDFLSNIGEKVTAPGDGVVTYVGTKGGYGKIIKINHGFGYETIYAHLSKYKVKKNQ